MPETPDRNPRDETRPEPEAPLPDTRPPAGEVWLRGLWMLLLMILFQIGQTVLAACTVVQFLWLLFAREKNAFVAEFGASLADWLARAARFNSGASEEKPFPWTRWGA